MNYEIVSLGIEKKLKTELSELFEFDIIEKILKEAKIEERQNVFANIIHGESLKITNELTPKLFTLCHEVKEKLEFQENIDFFIKNDSSPNAFAFPKIEDNDSNIIVLNSALIEKFDDEELKFIIGHEIGHLISEYRKLKEVIDYVFPDEDKTPLIFSNKIKLWGKLAELTADRFGFIASGNIDKIVTVFFKLASGLAPEKNMEFNPDAYLEEVERVISNYEKENALLLGSHPVNPIRIKALKLFSESKLYQAIVKGKELHHDEELENSVFELIQLLTIIDDSELSLDRSVFLVSGGLIIADVDEKMKESELEHMINVLSKFQIFPYRFFEWIAQSSLEERMKYFETSVSKILSKNPSERYSMMQYLIAVAISDREIVESEIELLYGLGQKIFGFTKKEIAQLIAAVIREKFVPKILLSRKN